MRVVHTILYVVLLSFITACVLQTHRPTSGPDCSLIKPVYPCEYTMSYKLDSAFTDPQKTAIRAGALEWTGGTLGRFCLIETIGDTSYAQVNVFRARTAADLAPYDDDWIHHAGLWSPTGINTGVVFIVTAYPFWQAVSVHEFGHALGLSHTETTVHSVMHPIVDEETQSGHIYPDDATELCAIKRCVCEQK